MFCLTIDERGYLTETRRLSVDASGNEVLVGLTYEETVFYLAYARQCLSGRHDPLKSERYLGLYSKHEAARVEVLREKSTSAPKMRLLGLPD